MYTVYYKLSGRPFKLSPDSRFFFGSRPHSKAMAYLQYGLGQGEGFIVITGDIGTGKSMLIDYLFSTLDSEKYIATKVVTTHLDAEDFLRMVSAGFGLQHQGADKATLLQNLESFLAQSVRTGKRALLVVDEVQNFPSHSLEELRMLSNFQLGEHPLLQIYLVGQPQFRQTFARSDMEQLRQRVIASYHLEALDAEQTKDYIEHRLNLVGWRRDPAFTDGAYKAIYERTDGVPRRINLLCERILLFGSLEDKHEIDHEIVAEVAADLLNEDVVPKAAKPSAQEAPTNKPSTAKKNTAARFATARNLTRLSKRVSQLENRLRDQSQDGAGVESLLPAIERLTRAVEELVPSGSAARLNGGDRTSHRQS